MKHIEIKEDTFDIVNRVKNLDNNYKIKRNLAEDRFEVFYTEFERDTLEFVVPFEELDERLINHLNKTRIENFEKLMREMEQSNLKLQQEAREEVMDEAKIKIKEMSKFIETRGDNSQLDFSESYKTKWV